MSEIRAQIVPQGKVIDFIDGKFRNETPEEYVRQEIEKSLVRDYRYAREQVSVDLRIKLGSKWKRPDLSIFDKDAKHDQENIKIIVECKAATVSPENKRDGVEQLKSYMAACLNARIGMWTNGSDRFCYRKEERNGKAKFVEVPDIPASGEAYDERPAFSSLRTATSDVLLFMFKRCHNYIAGNSGLQKPEAFFELLKIIFCKVEDERSAQINFYAPVNHGMNSDAKVKARMDKIFEGVKRKYPQIFSSNDAIELDPRVVRYIVDQFQYWSLLMTNTDVKGKAYEEIVGSNLRGDRGEFFTPRNICKMAVEMLDPGPEDTIIDPACGTGGFLTVAMTHVSDRIRESEGEKWSGSSSANIIQQETDRKIQEYAERNVVGIDINPNLVKASKMNMVMNNDGSGGLYQGNSLERPITWSAALRDKASLGGFDILFTNPPFGADIKIDSESILEQYALGHIWDYDSESDEYSLRDNRPLHKAQPPEILFIERCVQLLKPGTGRMAIVLPDGILGAPGLGYVRDWILRHTRILASIDLHPDTFQPRNGTQTSLMVLQRKDKREIELEQAARKLNDYGVFMAVANHIGHDKRGNTVYKRDHDGNELLETRVEQVVDVQDGKRVSRAESGTEKIVDDDTSEIVKAFREWLAEEGMVDDALRA